MAAQKGSDFLLKMEDTVMAGTFNTIGGFRSNTLRLNNETIDATNKDSAGVRELLTGGGIQSFSASGSGVFLDDAAFGFAEAAARTKTTDKWQVIIPDFGTYEGTFQITSLEFGGEHNGELTYTISLESAGALTFTTI